MADYVRRWKLSATSSTSPDAVYEQLADLHRHLDWADDDQSMNFRLLTLDPEVVATEGTEFTSTGGIPMSSLHFNDRSVVTSAEPPRRFGFTTASEIALPGGRTSKSTFTHLYEIQPRDGGCAVTYTMTLERVEHPLWRMSLPVMKQVAYGVLVPFFLRRGLGNLVARAESASG